MNTLKNTLTLALAATVAKGVHEIYKLKKNQTMFKKAFNSLASVNNYAVKRIDEPNDLTSLMAEKELRQRYLASNLLKIRDDFAD